MTFNVYVLVSGWVDSDKTWVPIVFATRELGENWMRKTHPDATPLWGDNGRIVEWSDEDGNRWTLDTALWLDEKRVEPWP